MDIFLKGYYLDRETHPSLIWKLYIFIVSLECPLYSQKFHAYAISKSYFWG